MPALSAMFSLRVNFPSICFRRNFKKMITKKWIILRFLKRGVNLTMKTLNDVKNFFFMLIMKTIKILCLLYFICDGFV